MLNTHTVIDLDQHWEIQCFKKIKSFAENLLHMKSFYLNNKHMVVCTQFMKNSETFIFWYFPHANHLLGWTGLHFDAVPFPLPALEAKTEWFLTHQVPVLKR